MKILYDGFIFSAQTNGGISRYFAELIKRLPMGWSPIVRLGNQLNAADVVHPRLKWQKVPQFRALHAQALARCLASGYLEVLDTFTRYDVFHPTYHWRLPERCVRPRRRPLVVTVFDMIQERFAAELDPSGAEMMAKKSMIESADAIICISENTKRELQARYAVPDARITVTYLAAGFDPLSSAEAEPIPPPPFVLFMGNRGVYKNFVRALEAFGRIAESWPELTLCIVGNALDDIELGRIATLRISKRVKEMGFVNDSQLASLYRASEALLYPSLYEGFGIPPLEAMACGTVVICSDASSLPEVVGDAAITVNPSSIDELAEAMLSLRCLGNRRAELIQRGLARARKFSWDSTAKQTVKVYESVNP